MTSQRHHDLPPTAQCLLMNAFSILVVDDMKANRLLLERILNRVGYQTIEAEDAPSALAQLADRQPDLVIFDVEMPGMTGIEAVARIRAFEQEKDHLPIIVASGNPSEIMEQEAMEAGADIFLTKPFDFPVLLAEIRTLLKTQRKSTNPRQQKNEQQSDERIPANTLTMDFAAKE